MRCEDGRAHVSPSTPANQPDDSNARRLLDVRIRPHRSLSAANFRLLMIMFSLIGIIGSIPFIVMGAWPVAGFMGADVLIFYLAFKANFRAARAYEDVIVTSFELFLAKVSSHGARREFRFHPAWVRLDKTEHEEFGIQQLSLCSRGRAVEVAAFLGPVDKAQFASGLTAALNEARRGPRYS